MAGRHVRGLLSLLAGAVAVLCGPVSVRADPGGPEILTTCEDWIDYVAGHESGWGGERFPEIAASWDLSAGGRLVRELAVAHGGIAEWDGRDRDGRRLPSGIYFCRASAAGERRTIRIVALR